MSMQTNHRCSHHQQSGVWAHYLGVESEECRRSTRKTRFGLLGGGAGRWVWRLSLPPPLPPPPLGVRRDTRVTGGCRTPVAFQERQLTRNVSRRERMRTKGPASSLEEPANSCTSIPCFVAGGERRRKWREKGHLSPDHFPTGQQTYRCQTKHLLSRQSLCLDPGLEG